MSLEVIEYEVFNPYDAIVCPICGESRLYSTYDTVYCANCNTEFSARTTDGFGYAFKVYANTRNVFVPIYECSACEWEGSTGYYEVEPRCPVCGGEVSDTGEAAKLGDLYDEMYKPGEDHDRNPEKERIGFEILLDVEKTSSIEGWLPHPNTVFIANGYTPPPFFDKETASKKWAEFVEHLKIKGVI